MKKIIVLFIGLLLASSALYADHDDIETAGIITDVNNSAKTISIQTPFDTKMRIQIMPNTEVELDDCGVFGLYDGFGSFKDLKVGKFIEVELFNPSAMTTGKGIAKEVKLSCKRSAY